MPSILEDALIFRVLGSDINREKKIRDTIKILRVLWRTIISKEIKEWLRRGFISFQPEEVLQQFLYWEGTIGAKTFHSDFKPKGVSPKGEEDDTTSSMFGMWKEWSDRCSPHRRESIKQLSREFGEIVQEMPCEETQSIVILYCLRKATESTNVMRQSLQDVFEKVKKGNPGRRGDETDLLTNGDANRWNNTEGEQAREGDAASVEESVRTNCPTIMSVNQNASEEVRYGTVANTLSTNGNASGRNAPLVIHPQVTGTICASGAGLNRPAGMGSELDLCIVQAQSNLAHSIVRRLLPIECERLQGFPDFWTECGYDSKPISDTQRYKALGNSVAIPCVEYIMQGISDCRRRVSIS